MTEKSSVSLKKQTVIYTHTREAQKKWLACLVGIIGAGVLFYLGIKDRKLNHLIISVMGLLYCGFHLWQNSRFLLKRKIFLILDPTGIYKQEGSLLVKWEEIDKITFTREKMLFHLVVETKNKETFKLNTYNVVPVEEISKEIRSHGMKIG